MKTATVGLAAGLFLGMGALSSSAGAASITADASIDITHAISGNAWVAVASPLAAPVSVSPGDTVTVNIGFHQGQTMSWDGSGHFNPYLMVSSWNPPDPGDVDDSQYGGFSISNISVTFLGLTQGTQLSGFPTTSTQCCIHLGPSNILGADNVARTFSGITLSFLVDSIVGDTPRTYSTIGYIDPLPLFGGNVAVASTPLPESLSLFLIALADLGGLMGGRTLMRRAAFAA